MVSLTKHCVRLTEQSSLSRTLGYSVPALESQILCGVVETGALCIARFRVLPSVDGMLTSNVLEQ